MIFILLILNLTGSLPGQDTPYTVTWDYRGQTFSEFAARAEDIYGLRFFFRDEWFKGRELSDYGDTLALRHLLDNYLSNTRIYYLITNKGDVILTSEYRIRLPEAGPGDDDRFLPSEILTESADDQKKETGMFIDIGNPADRNKPGNATVSGWVRTETTGEPIAGVTIYDQKFQVGAVTNQFGFYSLSLPRGTHSLQYTFIGMKEKRVNVNLYGDGEIDMVMSSVLIPLKEAVVAAGQQATARRFEVGLEKISIVNLRLLPTSLGESDIIKSVLFITGVKDVGEGSSGFNVRGGSADQNLILLYGAPLYNSNHFFGFFSAVNSEIIRDVTLYKGGIPARYGGRISSVLDIVPKDGNRKEFAGRAGISPVTANLMIEAPLIEDKCSFILTGRSTYSNWIFKQIDNQWLRNSMASFYDINGRISYDIDKSNKIELSSYVSNDAFRLNSDTLYRYDNNIISFKWRHLFSNRLFSQVILNTSNYRYEITSEKVLQDGFVMVHKVGSSGLKADFNWYPEGRSEINFGADFTGYSIKPGDFLPSNDSSLVIPHLIPRERAFESAVYFDEKYTLTGSLSLNAGIRFSSFVAFGPSDIMLYDNELPKALSTITDTLIIPANRIVRSYAGPELRLSINYRFPDNSSFKINYNKTRQYLHLLSNTTAISPTDTWKLCDYYLKPQKGDQVAIGFYKTLLRNSIETSAELYYKSIQNMIDYKGGAKLVMNENTETEVINVKGRAYGLELNIRSTEGRLRWSAGYTYSRILIRSVTEFSEELINKGKWFPANFDKPHDLNATFNFLFSRRFSFSASYIYNTGRPITYPVGVYQIGGISVPVYSGRNQYRIPDYSRLDLSIMISGNLRINRIARPHWTISVYNALGRANVYSVYFREEDNRIKGYRLSVFGSAIPSITYSFDF